MSDKPETIFGFPVVHIDMGTCGLCKNCKWWDSIGEAWGSCELANEGNDKISKASAYGREGAILQTQPDFGCVQFEAKESVE